MPYPPSLNRLALAVCLSLVGLIAPARAPGASQTLPSFVDIASEAGVNVMNLSGTDDKDYIVESVGNGAAFLDFDNDSDADLILTNGSTIEGYRLGGDPMATLYRNDGGSFTDVTAEAGINARGWAMGICAADYDNDGDSDVYLTAYGPNILYRNNGDGTFSERSEHAGVGHPGWGTNCAFGDYDRDGHVDLYVANYVRFDPDTVPPRGSDTSCRYMGVEIFCGPLGLPGEPDALYRNRGDGTFADVTGPAGIDDPGYYGFGVVFSDLDNDGWPDIYVANDSVPNLLFHNDRDGTFSEIGLLSGTALDENGRPQSGMGVDAADYDLDGKVDLFVTNFARDTNTLYRNLGGMFFVDATASAHLAEVSPRHLGWGAVFADLDNDGFTDILVANGHVYPGISRLEVEQEYFQRKEMYRNLGNGTFEEVGLRVDGDLGRPRSARGMALADIDGDGDLDAVAVNINGPPDLYRNGLDRHRVDGDSGWLRFRLEGTRSNRDAIGARVEIQVGSETRMGEVRSGGSFLSHNEMWVHFGLGQARRAERVRVRWPSGAIEELGSVDRNQRVTIREGEGIVPAPPFPASPIPAPLR